jgi:hypothetical protein
MASKANLIVDQGSTFSATINLDDSNGDDLVVTGYTSRSQMRKHYTSSNSVTITTALEDGLLTLSLTDSQTANIVAGRYVYDVELIDSSNNVTRIIEGIITVTPEVTR